LIRDNDVLKILEKAKTIGVTAKQIAHKLGTDEIALMKQLKSMHERKLISRIGRNLWIVKKYEKMLADPLFVKPEVYTHRFKKEFGIQLSRYFKGITFSDNGSKRIHRWSPYVQGFSADFVDDMLSKYQIEKKDLVLDPFCGSGTVLVCAKMRGINSVGVDLMPLMEFMARVKTNWDVNIKKLKKYLKSFEAIKKSRIEISPPFLKKTDRHFDPAVLDNLLRLKQFVWHIYEEDEDIGNLLKLAFASILVPSSNLKRAPCLGYVKNKVVESYMPFNLFLKKVEEMIQDLNWVQSNIKNPGRAYVIKEDARKDIYDEDSIDIAITSPPYVNGMDYVINYKIEMAWLDLVKSYEELRELKDQMVVCDNVSKRLIRNYANMCSFPRYSDKWLDEIEDKIANRLQDKKSYRRNDMHLIVRKYFDDLYYVLLNVYKALKEGSRFILVVGDSLMAGIYIPADLIVARIGSHLGYYVEDVLIARQRRSGQRHDFKLRESVIVLRKGNSGKKVRIELLDRYLDTHETN